MAKSIATLHSFSF